MKKIQLFCIPHAGGSCAIYYPFKRYIKENIELCPIELAGRGQRFNEDLYEDIQEAIEDVYKQVKENIKGEFAFYGHSMGGIIAFEVMHKLLERDDLLAVHGFFSGCKAPHIPSKDKKIHLLSEEGFKKEVLAMGGTPKEVFEEKELLELFLPLLRGDFKIIENYQYKEKKIKLDVDMSVLNGKEDDLSMNEIVEWKVHTKKKCKTYMFNGGHFFINQEEKEVVNIINYIL